MNVLKATRPDAGPRCPRVEGRERIGAEFGGYLSDESRMTAAGVDVVFLPECVEHVCRAARECAERGLGLVAAGARTGIVGGAVPVESQAVLALERLDRTFDLRPGGSEAEFMVRVEAGVILEDLQEMLRSAAPQDLPWADEAARNAGVETLKRLGRRPFYPVDPTETSAQVGATAATNASGARTFHYGATRRWVEALTVVLASGEVLSVRRGQVTADGGRFVIEGADGSRTPVEIPTLPMPATKNTAGYYLRPDMDAVDLFVGSEGTLGIITEVELRLALEPAERLVATAFLPGEPQALGFVRALREQEGFETLAIEYFGPGALDLMRRKRVEEGSSSGVPLLPDGAACAVYIEIAFDGDDQFERRYRVLVGLLEQAGSSARATWAGLTRADLTAMKAFRHALPETVNSIIGRRKRDVPALRKVGTDMAVPDDRLEDVFALYRGGLADSGLEHVIFGHVGDNHLHVNILPRSAEELERAMAIYEAFAREVVAMGGSVSAEHGIGRIKRPFLRMQYKPEMIERMQAVKQAFDPAAMLGRGVLFEDDLQP